MVRALRDWLRSFGAPKPRRSFPVALTAPRRYGRREPVRLETLARLLSEAGLGRVSLDGRRLCVTTREGHVTLFEAAKADAVIHAELQVTSSSIDLAALACEALAPRLGPMEIEVEGIRLEVDGTRPRTELERELHDLKVSRLSQLRLQLDRPASPQLPN